MNLLSKYASELIFEESSKELSKITVSLKESDYFCFLLTKFKNDSKVENNKKSLLEFIDKLLLMNDEERTQFIDGLLSKENRKFQYDMFIDTDILFFFVLAVSFELKKETFDLLSKQFMFFNKYKNASFYQLKRIEKIYNKLLLELTESLNSVDKINERFSTLNDKCVNWYTFISGGLPESLFLVDKDYDLSNKMSGFMRGVLKASELKKINSYFNISLIKKEYERTETEQYYNNDIFDFNETPLCKIKKIHSLKIADALIASCLLNKTIDDDDCLLEAIDLTLTNNKDYMGYKQHIKEKNKIFYFSCKYKNIKSSIIIEKFENSFIDDPQFNLKLSYKNYEKEYSDRLVYIAKSNGLNIEDVTNNTFNLLNNFIKKCLINYDNNKSIIGKVIKNEIRNQCIDFSFIYDINYNKKDKSYELKLFTNSSLNNICGFSTLNINNLSSLNVIEKEETFFFYQDILFSQSKMDSFELQLNKEPRKS